jgi:hypothetical protein
MSRRYDRFRIHVDCDSEGRPRSFHWQQKTYTVSEIVDQWVLRTLWWQEEIQRSYFRIMTPAFGIYGIYKENEAWYLDTALD